MSLFQEKVEFDKNLTKCIFRKVICLVYDIFGEK